MDYSVFDIETDGLLETVSKIHCMSVKQYRNGVSKSFTLINYAEMSDFILNEAVLVGHNIIRYDIPVIKKILRIPVEARLVDTLGISWYLYPNRKQPGLESWGAELGVEKPKIVDWSNLSIEEYIHRCETDVIINDKLFSMMMDYLFQIYIEPDKLSRLLGYISFKLDCAREQEEVRWKLDVEKCQSNLAFLEQEFANKNQILTNMMPKVTKYKIVSRPKIPFKKDGSVSANGQKWFDLLKGLGLPEYHLGDIKIPVEEVPGNPGSHAQLKAWLYSIGWIPETFKYEKEDDGSVRKIPQINDEDEICDSVKKLYEKIPELVNLEDYFIIRHRIGLLKGFLENKSEDNFLKAEVKGFTNTLRFQHTTIVNLPTIPKLYWEKVRGCLIAPDNDYILCGSDMSGLEDNTKRHYMYYFDPEYVIEMMEYGFDAHCDIAVLGKKMSKDDQTFYKWYDKKKEGKDFEKILSDYYAKNYTINSRMENSATGYTLEQLLAMSPEDQAKQIKILKPIRLKNKKVNFGGIYGAGPPKLAQTGGFSLAEAKVLHKVYWGRNWSVKEVAKSCVVKTIGNQMWLHNPVSQLWYSLRYDKDRFSTLNQGTGVYCFDSWVRKVRDKGIRLCGQFHDEIISPLLKGQQDEYKQKLGDAIVETNNELKLNVSLGISIDFGDNYAEIH